MDAARIYSKKVAVRKVSYKFISEKASDVVKRFVFWLE
jgi:hypothetical protein